MRIYKATVMAILAFSLAGALPVVGQNNWSIQKTFPVGGAGGWDYVTVDAESHRLFVPRSTHTMVIDENTGKVLGDIPGLKIAHGVAIAPQAGRGFISDGGGDGSVVVFDLKTYAVLGKVVTVPDSDGIIYDPALDEVMVVSGDKGVLMQFKPGLDLASGKIESSIDLGGSPEFLASDGKGKVYVNIMDKNEVAVVDTNAKKVVARWPVAPGGAPVGMALDTKRNLLFIGGRDPQKLIVMNTETGKVVSALPIGSTVDAIEFDGDLVFASCRDGSLAVATEVSPGKFELLKNVTTRRGASTMGLDPTTHLLYLPAAEFEKPAAGDKHPRAKPDSFMILVVGQRPTK